MISKQQEFNSYYENSCNQIKWFECYIQPKMLDEWNNQSIKAGMSLLDVGGGCSLDSIFFSSKGIRTVVLDFAEKALIKLRQMADFYGVTLEYEKASILDVPESLNGMFDIITDNGCFHHLEPEDRVLYINSIFNLLKPGGFLYIRAISEYAPPSSDNKLCAYRIAADDITNKEFLEYFKIVEMSLFDSILHNMKQQKMWFIKLQRR